MPTPRSRPSTRTSSTVTASPPPTAACRSWIAARRSPASAAAIASSAAGSNSTPSLRQMSRSTGTIDRGLMSRNSTARVAERSPEARS
jgi:hypothetical protein